jgi:outer membrane protein OmpA-like peptidoglycan-associated protein
MNYRIGTMFFLALATGTLNAQTKTRKLSTSINHPSLNLYAPYISADANAMVFISDNAEDQVLTPFFTFREASDWRAPQMLPKPLHSRVNFLRGYALSADGKKIYVTTMKSPGVGGFDIWSSDWKGSSWGEPVNPGMPINTKGHEACPSFTPDGNTMYFMRCEKMDQEKADNCKLFRVNRKSNGQWDEPAELPANINTGNSQVPRIMADAETLIFSSNKLSPNRGGMDLYVSTLKQGNVWSDPKPLEFANTPADDQYVTVNGLGRYLLRDAPGARKSELVEYLFPAELRPKGLMKIEGKANDPAGAPIAAYVSVLDNRTKKQVYNGKAAADGSFMLYLKEGSTYELSVEPEQDRVTFFAKTFDLTSDRFPQSERVNVVLKIAEKGDEIPLEVRFKPNTAELDLATSANELKRLSRVINANQALKLQVEVTLDGYAEDSVSRDDLTEVIYDTIVTKYDDIDSLGQLYQRDTFEIKTRWHNDRTVKQAQAIADYLVTQGVGPERLSILGNAIAATLPDDKKLIVKAVFR